MHEQGSTVLGAALDLRLPAGTPAGTYTATLTITAIERRPYQGRVLLRRFSSHRPDDPGK